MCKRCPTAALLFLFQRNNASCRKSLGRETKYVSTSQMVLSAELQMDLSLPGSAPVYQGLFRKAGIICASINAGANFTPELFG